MTLGILCVWMVKCEHPCHVTGLLGRLNKNLLTSDRKNYKTKVGILQNPNF